MPLYLSKIVLIAHFIIILMVHKHIYCSQTSPVGFTYRCLKNLPPPSHGAHHVSKYILQRGCPMSEVGYIRGRSVLPYKSLAVALF